MKTSDKPHVCTCCSQGDPNKCSHPRLTDKPDMPETVQVAQGYFGGHYYQYIVAGDGGTCYTRAPSPDADLGEALKFIESLVFAHMNEGNDLEAKWLVVKNSAIGRSDAGEVNIKALHDEFVKSIDGEYFRKGSEGDAEQWVRHGAERFAEFVLSQRNLPATQPQGTVNADADRLANTCAQHLLATSTDPGYSPGNTPKDIIKNYILMAMKERSNE